MLVYLRVYIYIYVGETSILVGKYQKKHQLMEVFLYNGYVHIYIYIYIWLVWNMNFIFPYIGNVMIPTDELIFLRGVETT